MKYLNAPKAIAAWNAIQPLSDRDRERLNRKFTVDFNFNSNHIDMSFQTICTNNC